MKMMNIGRLLAWALIVAIPLWFSSCKKDNAGGGDPVTPNSIEGSWKISAMMVKGDKAPVDYLAVIKAIAGEEAVACLTDTKITFNGTGKVVAAPSPSCKSDGADEYNPVTNEATWTVSGNKLTITDRDGVEKYDLTVNGTTMTWSNQEQDDVDGDGVKETYIYTIEFKRV